MGKRGPAPLHGLKADVGRVTASGALNVPEGLTEPGRSLWFRVAEHLQEKGLVGTVDSEAVEQYCVMYNLLKASERAALADPLEKRARCAVNGYLTAFLNLSARLGLTPADRARIQSVETDESSSEDRDLLND